MVAWSLAGLCSRAGSLVVMDGDGEGYADISIAQELKGVVNSLAYTDVEPMVMHFGRHLNRQVIPD